MALAPEKLTAYFRSRCTQKYWHSNKSTINGKMIRGLQKPRQGNIESHVSIYMSQICVLE